MSVRRFSLPAALAAALWILPGAGTVSAMGRVPEPDGPSPGAAAPEPRIPPRFGSWIVYWDEENGRPSFQRHGPALEELAVFAWHFDATGSLVPARPAVLPLRDWLLEGEKKPRPRLLATAVNDVESRGELRLKDPAVVRRVLSDPAQRARHLRQLMALAKDLDGLDIDYERLYPEDQELFTSFIRELGGQLHRQGKWLSVVVQPRTSRTGRYDPNGAGAIDWTAILPFVDRLKVMAYLYAHAGSAPGSIAPASDVVRLARYARKVVPPEKLCIILHLGGFVWPEGKPGRSIEYGPAAALAAAHGTGIAYDADSESGYFRFNDKGREQTVWIETAEGLQKKIDLLAAEGVRFIGLWRLGTGDPGLWESLPARLRSEPVR